MTEATIDTAQVHQPVTKGRLAGGPINDRTDAEDWNRERILRYCPLTDSTKPDEREIPVLHSGVEADTSTERREPPIGLDERIKVLFQAAKEEFFEDGMESEFSRELTALVTKYGDFAITSITPLILNERVSTDIGSEALGSLARIDHPRSHRFRKQLIESSLKSKSVQVRDSASLALAILDGPSSAPFLRDAIKLEPCEELRQNMTSVLAHLERSR